MDANEKRFMEELLGDFLEQAQEDIDKIEQNFLQMEVSFSSNLVGDTKRLIHSLKGSAQAVDLDQLAQLLHRFESYLEQQVSANQVKESVTHSLSVLDSIRSYLDNAKAGDIDDLFLENVSRQLVLS